MTTFWEMAACSVYCMCSLHTLYMYTYFPVCSLAEFYSSYIMKNVLLFGPHLGFYQSVIWCNSYFVLIGIGVPCRILYSFVSNLYVSFSGLITTVREVTANFSAFVYL